MYVLSSPVCVGRVCTIVLQLGMWYVLSSSVIKVFLCLRVLVKVPVCAKGMGRLFLQLRYLYVLRVWVGYVLGAPIKVPVCMCYGYGLGMYLVL